MSGRTPTNTQTEIVVGRIVQAISDSPSFSTFGGGNTSRFNPLTAALADRPPMFAAGVDVEAVVRFVLEQSKQP